MSASPWWSPERHADRRAFLHARANIARAVRDWFAAEGFVEADVGALAPSPGAEVHVAAFETGGRYLHASPEFAMKKLLAAGEGAIFFLGKCYRAGEAGPLHAPEFTMLEWYRARAPYARMMDDCVALVRVAAEAAGAREFRWRARVCDPFAEPQRLTVREAFARLRPSPPARSCVPSWEASDAFATTLAAAIEPQLGAPALTLLYEYPIAEAALAQACAHDPSVAERFELYACGVELANGFGELNDPVEQRARLEAAMAEKQRRYGARWPIDEGFLAAVAHMPAASGCALGFDRLAMLSVGARNVADVIWTPALC